MSNARQFIVDNIELIIGLGMVVLIVLAIIGLFLLRKSSLTATIRLELNDQVARLESAARHYVDVNAVVQMVRQLDADPDALELIKSYPETVRAAAWLHYINSLGSDLQAAQRNLSDAHQKKGIYLGYSPVGIGEARGRAQTEVDVVRAKLDAAIAASGQSGLRAV